MRNSIRESRLVAALIGLCWALACSSSKSNDINANASTGGAGFNVGSGGAATGGDSAGGYTAVTTVPSETPPQGLESIPAPANCTQDQTECNSSCLDSTHTNASGCRVVSEANVVDSMAIDQGYVYFSDYAGVSRVQLSSGTVNPISTDTIVSPMAASNGNVYFYSNRDSAVFSAPGTGGSATKIATSRYADFLDVADGFIVYHNVAADLNAVSISTGTTTQLVASASNAFSDRNFVYFTDSAHVLKKVDPTTPSTVTTLGQLRQGAFVVVGDVPYVVSGDTIYKTDLSASTSRAIWQPGKVSDNFTGTVDGPYTFPGAQGFFFFFRTTPFDHVMHVSADGTTVRRLGSFTPRCGIALVADATNVYVGTCRHIISLAY